MKISFFFFICLFGLVQLELIKYTFEFTFQYMQLGQQNRTYIAVNGQIPGPTIRGNLGDVLQVTVINKLPSENLGVHWHGLFQQGSPWYDGGTGLNQWPIPPRNSFVYQFTLTNAGTYWYHSHVAAELIDGTFGAILIYPEDDPYIDYDEILLFAYDSFPIPSFNMIADYYSGAPSGLGLFAPTGMGLSAVTCPSGSVQPFGACTNVPIGSDIVVHQGKHYRFRTIGSGVIDVFNISIDSHTVKVIEVDGTPVDPTAVQLYQITTGQRMVVDLHTDQTPSIYTIRAIGNFFFWSATLQLRYSGVPEGTSTSTPFSNPTFVPDFELMPSPPIPVAPTSDFRVEFNITLNLALFKYIINGAYSTLPPIPYLFDLSQTGYSKVVIPEGKTVDIAVINETPFGHPLHLHGHKFWPLMLGNPDISTFPASPTFSTPTNNIYRDTQVVPPFTTAVFRFVANNPGAWFFHCHILGDLIAGLFLPLLVGEPQITQLLETSFPAATYPVYGPCPMHYHDHP